MWWLYSPRLGVANMIKIGLRLIASAVILAAAMVGCSSAMLLLDAADSFYLLLGILGVGGIALGTLYILDKLWFKPIERLGSLTKEHFSEKQNMEDHRG
jgi:hypothetical protein